MPTVMKIAGSNWPIASVDDDYNKLLYIKVLNAKDQRCARKDEKIYNYPFVHQVFGCCGARVVDCVEDFNNTNEVECGWYTVNYKLQFNRGILIGFNFDATKVEEVPGSVVEQIKCGKDTLFLRRRTANVPYTHRNTP